MTKLKLSQWMNFLSKRTDAQIRWMFPSEKSFEVRLDLISMISFYRKVMTDIFECKQLGISQMPYKNLEKDIPMGLFKGFCLEPLQMLLYM